MTPDKVKCWNCTMTFEVAEPPQERIETVRCSEPRCGKRFWSCANGTSANSVKVGVVPADAYTYTPVHVPDR